MKKCLFAFVLLLSVLVNAQIPQSIPYQAVARNSSGNLIAGQSIAVRFSIHDATSGGTVVYQERQTATTNNLGLFNVNLGTGTPSIGTFSGILWGTNSKFIEVELDPTGGTTYTNMGTSQMMSVPYALYAQTSGNGAGPTGATGAAGATGPSGADGATGAAGINGTNGTNGSNGATGAAGTNGSNGATGPSGADGAAGATGPAGSNGAVGATGPSGPSGSNGTNGSNGAVGAAGPSGATGPTGPTGVFGNTGTTGDLAVWSSSTNLGNSIIQDDGTNVGIGNAPVSPNKLYVNGNTRTTGYMLVGNPGTPSNTAALGNATVFYHASGIDLEEWKNATLCGANAGWFMNALIAPVVAGNLITSGELTFTTTAALASSAALSPWIWIPTNGGSNDISVSVLFSNGTTSTQMGYRLEYTTNGGTTWTPATITQSTAGAAMNVNFTGDNPTTCTSGTIAGWTFNNPSSASAAQIISQNTFSGLWLRYRFMAATSASAASGKNLFVYCFDMWGNQTTNSLVDGSFNSGNIYAEKNVYAGSNVLMGDVAEYFPIDGAAEPGDLISISSNAPNRYNVSTGAKDARVMGVYSTNPTVTINNPNSGSPVALTGRVMVKVTNENGDIKVGDYLTASSSPGYAMKATGTSYVIGRALYDFNSAKGKIMSLVGGGWMNLNTSDKNMASGNFYIPSGSSTITVRDNSIGKDSKVFVSILNNPGSFYWLSKKDDGLFELTFDRNVSTDVHFDYFVENAKVSVTNDAGNSSNSTTVVSSNGVVLSDSQLASFYDNMNTGKEWKQVPLKQEDANSTMPPIPADPTKYYKCVNGKMTVLESLGTPSSVLQNIANSKK